MHARLQPNYVNPALEKFEPWQALLMQTHMHAFAQITAGVFDEPGHLAAQLLRLGCLLELDSGHAIKNVCGMYVQRIPGWLIWMHWIDPLNYTV